MFLHYLKIAWRNIWSDKLYSLINLVGLTVAFTVVILFVQWIRFELSYENGNPKANRIYIVQEVEKRPEGYLKHTIVKSAMGNVLEEKYPIIEDALFYANFKSSIEFNQESFMYSASEASLNFFNFFPMQIIAGTDAFVENRRGGVFISEKFAKRVFGDPQNAVDSEFTRGASRGKKHFDGVVRIPENSIIQFDILYLTSDKIESWGVNLVMLRKSVSFTEEQQRVMGKFLAEYGINRRLIFEPIKRVHLFTDEKNTSSSLPGHHYGNIREVRTFTWIVVLILLLAVINYVNTSTARTMNRAKEVVVRKISGTYPIQLMARFLTESFILSFIAIILALDFAKLLHHPFEHIIGNPFAFQFNVVTLLLALLICVVTTILSGGYAAFYLSSINPLQVAGVAVKSKLRFVLMGMQFAISIGVLICTWTVYRQLNYMLTKELGFDKENIYYFDSSLMYQSESFIEELQRSPYVLNATMTSAAPYNIEWEYDRVNWLDAPPEIRDERVVELACDHRFDEVFGLQMVHGEFIPPGLSWWEDANESSYGIVVNETFQKLMAVENPLGMIVEYGGHLRRKGKIIGVVKDFYFRPMSQEISPLVISFNPEVSGRMYIKIDPAHEKDALQHVRDTYDKMRANIVLLSTRPFVLSPLEKNYREMYTSETRLQKILGIFSFLSVVLSFMGVIGMVMFLIEKRTKEISIRKINGAKWFDIVKQFWKEFSFLMGMSSAVAVLFSLLFMHGWLQQYVYQPSFAWWIFILVPMFVAALTALILFLQIQGIARRNPVESLRSE